jgi:hypothetical protein
MRCGFQDGLHHHLIEHSLCRSALCEALHHLKDRRPRASTYDGLRLASDCDHHHKIFTSIFPNRFGHGFKQLNRCDFLLCAVHGWQEIKV